MNTILRKQFLAHVGQTSPEPMMIEVARAEGVFFYTPDGKRYYDLVAGVSVSNVGHANPRVVEAVQRQAADYMHIMVYGEMIERPQVRYAARIAELLPGELSSVYFVNSGAEAIEGALKLAKRYTHRTELVSMRRAYHGSTQGAMSLMGEPEGEEWKGAFRPLLPDVRAIDFNDFVAPESRGGFWNNWGYLIVTVAVIVVLFKVIFQLSWVPSGSMETTIPEDTLLISWQLPYMVSDPTPQRGDIVTFWSDELGKLLVKRVVGLPGDEITFQDGYTYINGEMLDESYLPRQGITQCSASFLVPEGCVFFMGDNRTGSNDARFWKQPYISVDNIRAKVMVGISVLPDNSWRGVRVIH